MNIDINALVDADRGLVSRSIFIDPQIYEQECHTMFTQCWMYLCHESQIPRPGDFCTAYIAEDPIIVWRDAAGVVRAFLNVCRHRGNRLCRADRGNASSLTCTYHGWMYGNDGKLKGVPRQEAAYRGELDRERWPLSAVTQVDSYKGLVFGTFDASAPPLREYLGELAWYLDAIFDQREGGVEVFPGAHKWILPCNWKFAAENFSGDSYHVPWNHLSAMSSGLSVRRPQPSDVNRFHLYLGNGHCVMARQPDDLTYTSQVAAYEQEGRPRVRARLGPRIDFMRPGIATVFPNFGVVRGTANSMRVWHPRGPDRTEIWSWTFVDREAPASVKEAVRLMSLRTFGPGGALEQDDSDNWQECTQTARGMISRSQVLNFQMGLGQERFDQDLRAWTTDFCTSESNQRHFYRHWAKVMSTEKWSALERQAAAQ